MKRRDFIKAGAALSFVGAASPLAAQDSLIPAYDLPEELLPREVRLKKGFAPFEIHVDPGQYGLFWTLPKQKAIRYAVGVGRSGLYESGEFYVGERRVWPNWTPTPEMIEREPEKYAQFSDGVPGGIDNPLGARGLYLFQPDRGDTYLRIHGTNDPTTIAKRVSNGCARLVNDQLIDLYNRVPLGTRVVLYPMRAA